MNSGQAIKCHASTQDGWVEELTVHILFHMEAICQKVLYTTETKKDYSLKIASTNKKGQLHHKDGKQKKNICF